MAPWKDLQLATPWAVCLERTWVPQFFEHRIMSKTICKILNVRAKTFATILIQYTYGLAVSEHPQAPTVEGDWVGERDGDPVGCNDKRRTTYGK